MDLFQYIGIWLLAILLYSGIRSANKTLEKIEEHLRKGKGICDEMEGGNDGNT